MLQLPVVLAATIGLSLVPLIRFGSVRLRNELRPVTERDPQLGRKFILEWFAHACIMLVIGGTLVSVLDAMHYFAALAEAKKQPAVQVIPNIDEDGNAGPPLQLPTTIAERTSAEWWNTDQRTATGLVVSGFSHLIVVVGLLLFFTNSRRHREVAVSFIVVRILIFGAVLLAINTTALIGFFASDAQDKTVKPTPDIQAVLIVVAPAFFLHLLWLAIWGRKKKALTSGESE
jgi:uncharacterized membrane protein YidH (DUF202 family)